MIVIRESFAAKPGMASRLARLLGEAVLGSADKTRILTDVVGAFNTVVIETEVDSLAAFEERMQKYRDDQEIKTKMAGYTDLYTEGRREIYQIVGSSGGRLKEPTHIG
jgi:hypothetical protein